MRAIWGTREREGSGIAQLCNRARRALNYWRFQAFEAALMWDLSGLTTIYGDILSEKCIDELTRKTALALARGAHRPGVNMRARLPKRSIRCELVWAPSPPEPKKNLDDEYNVTEYAAMAMALIIAPVVHPERRWSFHRRTVRGEFADIVLTDETGGEYFIEVSGVADRDPRRISEKVAQARRCAAARKAACVVEFGPPQAHYRDVGEETEAAS
jgi:hypothetical protein